MTIPAHVLHIYQKAKQGDDFITQYPIFGYRHRIAAMGGFDTASGLLAMSRHAGEWFYENMVGNRVAVFVDNPVKPVWEGLISRVTFNLPGVTLTRSLDEMANRVTINYEADANANPASLGLSVDTISESIYGVKLKTIRSARLYSGFGAVDYQQSLLDRMLASLAYPQVSTGLAGNARSVIQVEMIGFYHTLDWETTNTAGKTYFRYFGLPPGHIDNMLTGMVNTFIDSSDRTGLVDNGKFYSSNGADGKTCWQLVQMLAECGNDDEAWVGGVDETDWQTKKRRLYFRPANIAVEYSARITDNMRIRTPLGRLVPLWEVRPDRSIKITDALTGWDGLGSDPRISYLSFIEYDADSQTINWQSEDNTTIRGALGVDTFHSYVGDSYSQRAQNPLF